MHVATRLTTVCAVLFSVACPAFGQDPKVQDNHANPMAAIRADRWEEAQTIAAVAPDPLAETLVRFYRMMAPGAATAQEIAAFMRDHPDWPSQNILERRRQEAIAQEPDDRNVLDQCTLARPSQGMALLRCAEALANAGRTADATAAARDAWIGALSDSNQEIGFLRRWSGIPTAQDQWTRFNRLIWHDQPAAARQVARLETEQRKLAEARLALRRDDPNALALVDALSAGDRAESGLIHDRLRYLRRTDRSAEAAELWREAGNAAQRAEPDHLAEFWAERHLIARKLLKERDDANAYAIVAGHGQVSTEAVTEAEFLAGFIALRRLNDPALARRHFQALADASKAAITQGRAHYWIGRSEQAAGGDPTASWRRAAAWPTTFYGQLATLALGEDVGKLAERIRGLKDPAWTQDAARGFASHEVVRAAELLASWGEPKRARSFLLRMDELAQSPAVRTMTAELALKLGVPDTAVFVARRVGRDGGMLPRTGWPMAFEPPGPLDPAVALGIMRQESSFDTAAISSSGARGLMQLMPFTAQSVAKRLGIPTSLATLTGDPAHNMRLGTRYLTEVLDKFGGALPLAAAGYNAGPHRVDQWLRDYGDPRTGQIAMLDWLEQIPFHETRNYVQRVLENVVIYRALRGDPTPTMMAQWAR